MEIQTPDDSQQEQTSTPSTNSDSVPGAHDESPNEQGSGGGGSPPGEYPSMPAN
jgi:hypothetical protein